jgi:uncharacterized protein (UPF0297 family)
MNYDYKVNKKKEMKKIEILLFNFLKEKNFNKIMSLIGILLRVSKKPENLTKNQYKNELKKSNPDFLVYQEFIQKLLELELTDTQIKAIAFYLSRLLYFKILTIEDLIQNSNASTNVQAEHLPDFIKDFIRILNKLELFKKENNISLRLNLLSLFIKKLNSNRTRKGPNNLNLTQPINNINSKTTPRIANNYTGNQFNLSNILSTTQKNNNNTLYD